MWLRTLVLCLCLGTLSQAALPPGFPLPDVPILGINGGKKIDVRDYRGKAVILVMISLDCGHCVTAIQFLTELQKEFGPRGLQVVGVAGDEHAQFELIGFLNRFRPNFPVGYLDKAPFLRLANLPPDARPFVPIAMFIDPKGMVRVRLMGNDKPMKTIEDTLLAGAKDLLSESAPFLKK